MDIKVKVTPEKTPISPFVVGPCLVVAILTHGLAIWYGWNSFLGELVGLKNISFIQGCGISTLGEVFIFNLQHEGTKTEERLAVSICLPILLLLVMMVIKAFM